MGLCWGCELSERSERRVSLYLDIAKKVTTDDRRGSSHANEAWDEFLRNAVRTETNGLRDPNTCSTELARRIRTGEVLFEAVERFEGNFACPGQACVVGDAAK